MNQPFPELKFIKNPIRYKIAESCPCGKDNRNNKFVPYEGYTDKGYCHSCGETFLPDPPPFEKREDHSPSKAKMPRDTQLSERKKEPVTAIPFELFEQSVNPSNIQTVRANSSLFQGLLRNKQASIPEALLIEAMNRFYVGFSDYQFTFPSAPSYSSPKGANVFWLIDEQNRIRGGQVVLFDQKSIACSTQKQPDRHTRPVYLAIENQFRKKGLSVPLWLKEYKDQQGNKMPCLFGLPQLKKEPTTKPIAICEAPKTALVGWIYFPEYIWLAIGSRGMLKAARLKPLSGRNVTLFPDLSKDGSTFELWNKAATDLQNELKGSWNANRVLEDAPDLTDEEKRGADLADYLLTRWNWKEFQAAVSPSKKVNVLNECQPQKENKKGVGPLPAVDPEKWEFLPTNKKEDLLPQKQEVTTYCKEFITDYKLNELEDFFQTATIPNEPIRLNQCSTITDVSTFARAHIATARANQGKQVAVPYLERLEQLKEILGSA